MPNPLDILPDQIPQLPAGPHGARSARGLLERIPDSAGLAAARLAWILYQDFADPESRHIHAPMAALERPKGTPESMAVACHPIENRSCRGAGYALCADHSLLVFQSLCQRPWSAGVAHRTLRILPIVFRLAPIIESDQGPKTAYLDASSAGYRSVADRDATRDAALAHHLTAETIAWADWSLCLPDLVDPREPDRAAHNGCWPAFFPNPDLRSDLLADFIAHAEAAISALLTRLPGITRGQVSIWSARPLQGGLAPPRITAFWHGDLPMPKAQIDTYLHALLFGVHSPWNITDFIGHTLMSDGVDGFTPDPILLADLDLRAPPSGHARAALLQRFPAPNSL